MRGSGSTVLERTSNSRCDISIYAQGLCAQTPLFAAAKKSAPLRPEVEDIVETTFEKMIEKNRFPQKG